LKRYFRTEKKKLFFSYYNKKLKKNLLVNLKFFREKEVERVRRDNWNVLSAAIRHRPADGFFVWGGAARAMMERRTR
jgi:hypothetical protein